MPHRHLVAWAVIVLMFPQLAQTLYSPALTDFSQSFGIPPSAAAQVLSVYFLCFALGVVLWGRLCDSLGRRPALMAGLLLFTAATAAGLGATSFGMLLASQGLAALGIATCSIGVQTVLRDRFQGPALGSVFSLVGMALALSPALGLFAGAALTRWQGYQGVLLALMATALLLLGWTARRLPETRLGQARPAPLWPTLQLMLRDRDIWQAAGLVALFNIAMFSYYATGPFLFARLGLSEALYGYSGALLAAGAALGAWVNRRLLAAGHPGTTLVRCAIMLMLLAGSAVWLLQDSVWLLLPLTLIVLAYGMAIPNLLGAALHAYGHCLGTAGALFGLLYYLLIGAGMWLAGQAQALGPTLTVCAILACLADACGGAASSRRARQAAMQAKR
ncbi:putative MFS family arabinose efflux permease [Kerstersia gyiorum]|uniref:Putative MFS family arabinose efflux permease n=1 Tax=Kerstersia gyiorum TaxID=206506 RepID=A0A4Q7MP74_9BURK|nr:MFS transporter [Kerstersia gyiorum]KAB0543313.1 multidrug effflux MFS transporter [Kerstersia gyiorum]RZS70367.1 putative MFS family arabinose efflux permease [Kerstersia gyiorum]